MSLLRVSRGSIGSYFSQLNIAPGMEHSMEGTGRCVIIKGAPIVTILSKTDAGELEPGVTEVPAQRRAKLEIGQVSPNRCNPLLEVNPALYERADVQFQRLYEEAGLQELTIYISTKQKVDLNDLDWLVRLYALN